MGRAGKIHLACLREAGGEEARVCWLVDTDAAVLAPYAQVPLSLSLSLTLTLTLTLTLALTLTLTLALQARAYGTRAPQGPSSSLTAAA